MTILAICALSPPDKTYQFRSRTPRRGCLSMRSYRVLSRPDRQTTFRSVHYKHRTRFCIRPRRTEILHLVAQQTSSEISQNRIVKLYTSDRCDTDHFARVSTPAPRGLLRNALYKSKDLLLSQNNYSSYYSTRCWSNSGGLLQASSVPIRPDRGEIAQHCVVSNLPPGELNG